MTAQTHDLPPFVLAQLSAVPEPKPDDFTCVICRTARSNRWIHSPRDYELPPICKTCEQVSYYSWNGTPRYRTKPSGGSFRDRRMAVRIAALADALEEEARRQQWNLANGRA